MSDDAIDISDPDTALRLGRELATDLLREVAPSMMAMPLQARVFFFQAYMSVLLGGMRAVLGEELRKSTLEHLQRMIEGPQVEKPRLH